MGREACDLHLVVDGPDFTVGDFGLDQLIQQTSGLVVGWCALFGEFGIDGVYLATAGTDQGVASLSMWHSVLAGDIPMNSLRPPSPMCGSIFQAGST